MLNSCRDNTEEGAHPGGEGGEELALLGDPGPELRLGREKEKEKLRRQWMGWAKKNTMYRLIMFITMCMCTTIAYYYKILYDYDSTVASALL